MKSQISLIISVYNRIDFLKMIFAALESQTFKQFEVVIADDGSGADFVHELNSVVTNVTFSVKHIWHEDIGWRKNTILNKAVIVAEGEYLIFIDGDCIPHPYFIQEHFENRKRNQVICGRRVTLTEKISTSLNINKIKNNNFYVSLYFPLLLESLRGKETHIKQMFRLRNKMCRSLFIKDKIKGFWGCNFSLFKDDLMSVNGFDERYIHPSMGEDTDLDYRLRNNGIFPYSKKFLATIYHIYHTHKVENIHEMNYKLFEENLKGKVSYTPFGILKTNNA
jgi:glycosyltransferase involved in cell wall biosynthesis